MKSTGDICEQSAPASHSASVVEQLAKAYVSPGEIAAIARCRAGDASSLVMLWGSKEFESCFGYGDRQYIGHPPSTLFSAATYHDDLLLLYDAWKNSEITECMLSLQGARKKDFATHLKTLPIPALEGKDVFQYWKLVFYPVTGGEGNPGVDVGASELAATFPTIAKTSHHIETLRLKRELDREMLLRRLYACGDATDGIQAVAKKLVTIIGNFLQVDRCSLRFLTGVHGRSSVSMGDVVEHYLSPLAGSQSKGGVRIPELHDAVDNILEKEKKSIMCIDDPVQLLESGHKAMRTLQELMMQPDGEGSLLAVGLWFEGQLVGSIALLHSQNIRFWQSHERTVMKAASFVVCERLRVLQFQEVTHALSKRSHNEAVRHLQQALYLPVHIVKGYTDLLVSEAYGPVADSRYHQCAVMLRQSVQVLVDYLDYATEKTEIDNGASHPRERCVKPDQIVLECFQVLQSVLNPDEVNRRVVCQAACFSGSSIRVNHTLIVRVLAGIVLTGWRVVAGDQRFFLQAYGNGSGEVCFLIEMIKAGREKATPAVGDPEHHAWSWRWNRDGTPAGMHPELLFMLKFAAMVMNGHAGKLFFALAGGGDMAVKLVLPKERRIGKTKHTS